MLHNITQQDDNFTADNNCLNGKVKNEVDNRAFNLSLLEYRMILASAKPKAVPADVNITENFIPIKENIKMPVRIYSPKAEDPRCYPTVFYIPGTAFIANELKFTDIICSHICEKAKCQVIILNYRLAPENQFPKGFNDAYRLFKAFITSADKYRIDINNIAICGYSSGGTFAAGIIMKAIEENIKIKKQVLVSPVLDCSRSSNEYEDFEKQDDQLPNIFVRKFLDLYIPEGIDRKNPIVSPFWHPPAKVDKTIPTDIIVAEYDRFRGDSELYFKKLQEAKVPVNKFVIPNEKHLLLMRNLEVVNKVAELISETFFTVTPSCNISNRA